MVFFINEQGHKKFFPKNIPHCEIYKEKRDNSKSIHNIILNFVVRVRE